MACAQAPALSWGKGGQESLAPCEKLSHSTTSWVCMLERGREHMFVCVCMCVFWLPVLRLVQESDQDSSASPYRLGR